MGSNSEVRMRISKVELKNIGPHKNLTVEFGKGLIGLVGSNGAGKSTLFHDVAVWMICRNRAIRVMIGSISQTLAKMYSRRIRETLERAVPVRPDPEMVKRGLALDGVGCLAIDYGRFKPQNLGALWRAEEFIVEQLTAEIGRAHV